MGRSNKNETKSQPITKQMVWEGYLNVKSNAGGAGVDQMTIKELEKDLGGNLYKLWNRLTSGSYFPPPVKRVYIPKGGGKERPLGIPTVLDRIAQSVVKAYMEPSLEAIFHNNSYGYRPKRCAHDALEKARKNCWKHDWVIDLDIKGFFDNINHEQLKKAVEKHFTEKWVQMYINRWLKAGVVHLDGRVEEVETGTPQGGVVSPLLANLYLHYALDVPLSRKYPDAPFERYADDIIVHCIAEQQAEEVLEFIRKRLLNCGLELHPEKTKIVCCRSGRKVRGKGRKRGFTFLGYDFRPRKKWNRVKSVQFLGFDLGISEVAKARIRKELLKIMSCLRTDQNLSHIAKLVNAKIRGWHGYYGKLAPGYIRTLWVWFNYRLVLWLRRKYKRFKRGYRKSTAWLRNFYLANPTFFYHWKLATP